jgi:hypothetical protein
MRCNRSLRAEHMREWSGSPARQGRPALDFFGALGKLVVYLAR